jgi:integrase
MGNLAHSMRPMLELYGEVRAEDITPRMLVAVRDRMIAAGISVGIINQRVNMIRRVWKWLTRTERVPAAVWHGLCSVEPIKPGRTKARVSEPVRPVAEEWIEAACRVLCRSVATMVQVQHLSGMRPGEICAMRPCDIDMSGEIWIYRPKRHKTAHHGHERRILLGPRAQELLAPYLQCELGEPIFRPAQAREEANEARRAAYVPPEGRHDYRRMPSYLRRRAAASPTRYRPQWTPGAYGLAIRRACVEAGIPHWSPNQLRHSAATRVRKAAGLDVAQVILGHKHAAVTEVYAEADLRRAVDLVQRLG